MVKPSRCTTKVRMVYDASAKSRKNVKCLNDCLYRGPITLPDLCGVLLRLCTYLIVILTDAEKAFLQIGIQRQERDVKRFLWFCNCNQPEKVEDIYRFCRVLFGIVSRPFLLEGTLNFIYNVREHQFLRKFLIIFMLTTCLLELSLLKSRTKFTKKLEAYSRKLQ